MVNAETNPRAYKDLRVVVMGLGRFGGGLGIARWLAESGAHVLVTDPADKETLASSITELKDLTDANSVEIVLGPHDPMLLNDADLLVVNPAVPTPWNHPFIQAAIDQGIELTTEIEIAYRQLDPSRVIAVTGTAGKSTTSAMIHHALNTTGHHSILAGNIGGSLLTQLNELTDDTIVVLELSSAMLHWLWAKSDSPLTGPAVACITNCTPNHLDWHGSDEHYAASKQLLAKAVPNNGHLILGDTLANWAQLSASPTTLIAPTDALSACAVPGQHNALNAAMALAAAQALTQIDDPQPLIDVIRTFPGLPHRLNLICDAHGVRYYNDSKSTTPQATCLAIDALSEHTHRSCIHLIAGGYDKGSDLSPIAKLAPTLAGLYTIGATGQSLATDPNAHHCITLEAATKQAINNTKPGDLVVLSPGCASWDQFTNYEQRGDAFATLVRQLTGDPACSSKP